ncbi:hypothetical protein [Sediminibacterium ginsengisoli]|uniref:Uncharacterized protein n=1 Tax=Sediminibacterium ginsengisoli TaxID=413434 RepID=A0A1T4RQP2_9BACT|nr:hypothetical protein [Sediminibacterium ginsengisoli]SKA18252.1 hypothetical protein SAMN04488132_1144 [Sediminibacterium ginsengisoli]
MKKVFSIAIAFTVAACGRESSPEGRSVMRDEQLQAELNLVKEQNKALLDSIAVFRLELNAMKAR